MQVTYLGVHSFDIDFLDIWWEIDAPENLWENHSLYLCRSESQMGPWTDFVVGPLKDKWRYRDNSVNQKHATRTYWYRLEIRQDDTQETVAVSEPNCMQAPTTLEGLEIVRRFSLALRAYMGRQVIVYPVRTFGARCGACWDAVRQRKLKENCRDCFGIGFAGGFLTPYKTYVQKDPYAATMLLTDRGEVSDAKTTMRCLPYPIIKPGDVIIERENVRWRVMVAAPTERLGSAIHLELQLDKIEKTEVAFAIPVALDVEDFLAVPRRNLTEVTSLESAKSHNMEFDDVFSLYGTWFR